MEFYIPGVSKLAKSSVLLERGNLPPAYEKAVPAILLAKTEKKKHNSSMDCCFLFFFFFFFFFLIMKKVRVVSLLCVKHLRPKCPPLCPYQV